MALETVGLRTSLWNNNFKSILLLTLLPLILGGLIWSLMMYWFETPEDAYSATVIALAAVAIWFIFATVLQEKITMTIAGAREVSRILDPELYNLTENLSIAAGIKMPRLYMMDTDAMNAFASGLRVNNAAICVTRGLVERLNKAELEAVLAHEISHITHRDMRLMTIATLFVGIIALIAEIAFRSIRFRRVDKKGFPILIVIIVASTFGYFVAILSKFALSRRREFMADAGSVALTKDKEAMISALEKISGHSEIPDSPPDLRFMFFDNTESYLGFFRTHPSIQSRISALRKF